MKSYLKLALALALSGVASTSQAAIITVDFTISAGGWIGYGPVYGLTDPMLTGSVDIDTNDTSGNSFKALTYITGTRTWTLADIDIGGSSVTFDGVGAFWYFGLYLSPYNYVETFNTAAVADPASGGFHCNDCVSANVRMPETGAVPEPVAWALLVTGFGLVGAALRRRRAAFA